MIYAPMSGMEFEPVAQAAERVVEAIGTREEADFICLFLPQRHGQRKGGGL